MLRIKLRYEDVEAMIQRFAVNVGKTGLFLPTKSIQPLGAEIKFELRLATDQPVLVGLGRVKAAREPDPENPTATFGMAIELMRVTRESRDLILKMLERRRSLGLPDTGLPMPADIDAARRADFIDTGVRDYASGAVPMIVPAMESSPLPEPLMTAPRRQTGPMAVAKVAAVEPLPPEPPRRRRVPVAELIASASGPIVASFTSDGLDEDVDVAAVLARARALAGCDLDSELEALREASAAPIEIDVEAASAELARQLGGAAVRRDRSARWAPPPATTSESNGHAVEPAIEAPQAAATEIDRIDAKDAFGRDVDEQREDDEPPETPETHDDEQATPIAEPETKRAPTDGLIHDDADASQFEDAQEVEPEQIHDEIHRLDEGDFEEVENTQIGAPVDPEEFALADRLDAQLDEAEREDLGFSETMDAGVASYRENLEAGGFSLEEAPAAGDFVMPMHAQHDPGFEAALVAAADEEENREEDIEEDIEEIDDFEILAEADAEDADLLASAAEREVAGDLPHEVPEESHQFELPPARPSFLSRLELGDDSGYRNPAPEPEPGDNFDELAHEPGELDPRILSAGYALRAFEEPDDFDSPGTYTPQPVGEASYTFAGDLSADEFDAPHGNYAAGNSSGAFVPPDAFDQSDVIAIRPATPLEHRSEDFPDLENALAALDVDLDDLGGIGPPGARKRRNANARAVRGPTGDDVPTARADGHGNIGSSPTEHAGISKSGRVHQRATTEDGILIDFDDDD